MRLILLTFCVLTAAGGDRTSLVYPNQPVRVAVVTEVDRNRRNRFRFSLTM